MDRIVPVCVGILASAANTMAQCPPQATLMSSAPMEGERFGEVVAIRGDRAAAGTRLGGKLYAFHDAGAGWAPDEPIALPFSRTEALAFGDDRLLVGGGAALIYAAPVAGSSAWTLEARIDGPGPYFAARVAMTTGGDGAERAFIIAPNDTPGSVIIMRREPGGWVEEARISGYAEPFAQNVAADGDTVAVIGDASFAGGGTAYIFEREGAEWVLTSELSEQLFLLSPYGVAMDLRGDVLAISVSRTATDPLPEDPHGRVFVYRREGGRWAREAVINEDGSRGDWYFAQSLSFAGEWLAVESTGEIQMYMPRDGDWEYVGRFWAPVPYGGTSVAGARDAPARIVVGEPYTSRRTGAAYVFSLAACFCRADLSGDGKLDIFDVLMFLSLFDAGDLRADFDESGALDIFDFLAFQNAFAAGCP